MWRRILTAALLAAAIPTAGGCARDARRVLNEAPEQYVIVHYPDSRSVYVDGREHALTNRVILISPGHYEFSLGSPDDYRPKTVVADVRGTSRTAPKEIVFEKLPASN
ncbi:MAG: hypothetical protein BIFFINMI_02497 [Phycisphaerae bacterium]|nr:hypothetical protein [Phycisphaerae bacterium]